MENSNAYQRFDRQPHFPSFIPRELFDQKGTISEEILPEILFLTSYPPRECGIATYSEDLIKALERQFIHSFSLKVCALESDDQLHVYSDPVVKYALNTSRPDAFRSTAAKINADPNIATVVLQHEFGFFAQNEDAFKSFITDINKPLIVVFHTVLPSPDEVLKSKVQLILDRVDGIIVMTKTAKRILERDYQIMNTTLVSVIPHGTHLVPNLDKEMLKEKYGFEDKKILSTFGLLNSGKSIETTLDALPSIVKTCPEVVFLIIGKTHPTVAHREGEVYRKMLESKIGELGLENNVRFINKYLPLNELLEYLQMTDIYLFTSKDPNQAVSGTFSYALSCGCPIVSTPIPHAKEVLGDDTGLLFDFGNSRQLADCVNRLLFDVHLRNNLVHNGMHKITSTSWENAAVSHAKFFKEISQNKIGLHYRNPDINLAHLKKMTTDFGILQFCKVNRPDVTSGYTLDDNSRALIAFCQHYKLTQDPSDLPYIEKYLNFIAFCECSDGKFVNYVDYYNNFTKQNREVNLEDSTGRAVWALGYVISLSYILPDEFVDKAEQMFERALRYADNSHSPRAMAFIIKGIYYYNRALESRATLNLAETLANRLVQMYRHEASENWLWFEGSLTYANSVLPEALLCTYAMTGNPVYKDIAKESFDFLLSKTFTEDAIKVVSNKSWHLKDEKPDRFGEQPIDVAYTIIALRKFHDVFKEREYLNKMEIAFNWFLGNNHLQQVVYNPCTGGCFDGLEESNVNLNQGAESSISYLMARLMSYKFFGDDKDQYQRRRTKTPVTTH